MSYFSAIYLSAHPFKPQDRKGSFTTRPAGKVPVYKKNDKKSLLYTITSMLAQYQLGGHVLFEWWGKPEYQEENHRKLVGNRQNLVDVTKKRCKATGLPVGMGIRTDKLPNGEGQRELPRGYTVSLSVNVLKWWRAPSLAFSAMPGTFSATQQ